MGKVCLGEILVGFISEVANTWKCRTTGIRGVMCGFSESLRESVIMRGGVRVWRVGEMGGKCWMCYL